VIAIVAGTRTKSGSTNFLRLHVLGEHNQEGMRFFAPREEEVGHVPAPAAGEAKPKRKSRTFERFPSPNPPKISNP
jgi:pyruvate kinase